jgi:hypothetical protein
MKQTCSICLKEGERVIVEKLPSAGRIEEIRHKDGSKPHRFASYSSIYDIGHPDKLKPNPRIIKCPRCGKEGRVNAQRRFILHRYTVLKRQNKDGSKEYEKTKPQWREAYTHIRYIVTHEKLPGSWGHRVDKRRRCCIISQKDRDYVLKKLGRYIASTIS